MEYLQDASCRKCSFETTVKSLSTEIDQLKHQSKKTKDIKKKRDIVEKLVNLERAKREIEYRLAVGRIEEEEEGHDRLPLLRSVSRMSSKQVMLAKPPKILTLHISRSAFLNTGAIYKNSCQLLFPEYLDVSPFSTNGTLHTQPNLPISTPVQQRKGGYFYRLMSVVVHYGSHSFGHFVAFKRRIYADQCKCHQCSGAASEQEVWKCQNSWYRISDTKVDGCSLDDVLRSNPYMLLYELVEKDDIFTEEDWIETEEEEDMSVISSVTEEAETEDYTTNIPIDDATREALRIANSLLTKDHSNSGDLLLADNDIL
jgi:ubiquitin carboxyl-terminal hydrolase 1